MQFDSNNVQVQVAKTVGPFVTNTDPTKQPVITSVVEQSPPPPTCVAPNVLQGNACVTPLPSVVTLSPSLLTASVASALVDFSKTKNAYTNALQQIQECKDTDPACDNLAERKNAAESQYTQTADDVVQVSVPAYSMLQGIAISLPTSGSAFVDTPLNKGISAAQFLSTIKDILTNAIDGYKSLFQDTSPAQPSNPLIIDSVSGTVGSRSDAGGTIVDYNLDVIAEIPRV